jgi:hypothetical protein
MFHARSRAYSTSWTKPSSLWSGLLLFLVLAPPARAQVEFLRGDTNFDGQVSISDAVLYGCILFCGSFPLPCEDVADVNDSGVLDIVDLVRLLEELFTGDGPQGLISPPYPVPGLDPTADGLSCGSYPVKAPIESDDRISLGTAAAAPPGGQALVPVYLSSTAEVYGFQLVIRSDPNFVTPAPLGSPVPEAAMDLVFRGTIFENTLRGAFLSMRPSSPSGVFRLGFLPSFVLPVFVPPGSRVHVLNIPVAVSAEATPGTIVELSFADEEGGDAPLRTEVSSSDEARIVAHLDSGFVRVTSLRFRRGDATDDGELDISDAIAILNPFFLGVGPIRCRDAMDSDDNGRIEITDAIRILAYLFLGGATIPPPLTDCGEDPTLDELDCGIYGSCD